MNGIVRAEQKSAKVELKEVQQAPLSTGGMPIPSTPSPAVAKVLAEMETMGDEPAAAPKPAAPEPAAAAAEQQRIELIDPSAEPQDWVKATKGSTGYLQDSDLTHLLKSRVQEVFQEKKFRVEDWAHVLVTSVEKFEGHANVATKADKRALFYSIDVTLTWAAVPKKTKESEADPSLSDIRGVFRLYNVAQDTQFEPGGGDSTSFMYQLGHAPDVQSDLLDQIKAVGEELFHRFSGAIKFGVIDQLIRKCEKRTAAESVEMIASSAEVQHASLDHLSPSSKPTEGARTNEKQSKQPTKEAKPIRGFFDKKVKKAKKKESLDEWAEQRKPKGFNRGFLDRKK